MEDELRPSELAVGYVGGLAALLFLGLVVLGGAGAGCPINTPATGLCAMPWSFQMALGSLRVAYAFVGFIIVAAGTILITRRSLWTGPIASRPTSRRYGVAVVVLALMGVVLLVATAAAGFQIPPATTMTFTNAQLPSVGGLYEPYYGTERAATVYLTAGEAITATFAVTWYANGSGTPAGYTGAGSGFPPTIAPAGQLPNYTSPWTTWYIVPRTGAYTITFDAMYPGYYPPYTSNATLTVIAYNVAFYPTVQLAMASLGGISFAAAVAVDWLLHPRGYVRRKPPEGGQPKA